MIRSREPKDVLLRSSQLILYLGFVFLWFKGNIAPLKSILISPLVPGIPLLVLTGWRLFLKLKRRGFRPPIVSRKILWAVAAIALTALAFRIPYLLNNQGLVTSDDAITGLMGKHIADGRLAPICFYGQLYIGSLGSHIYALMFRLFGYSVVCFKLTTVLLYLGFLLVHFLLLKELFPFPFAVLVSLSYGLPLGELVGIGFDESLICPGVLLLGTAIVYLGYRATCQKRDDLIPWLGFLMGISFWTHQMTVYFIVVAVIMAAASWKFAWKKYAILGGYGLVGFFPMIMQEIYNNFHLVRFITAGERVLDRTKIATTLNLASSLLASNDAPGRAVFLIFALIGFAALIILALRSRRFLPANIYNLFAAVFFLMYLLSGHSNKGLIRYLYPLVFCLPILLTAWSLLLKPRVRYAAGAALVAVLLIFFNVKGQFARFLNIREVHRGWTPVLAALEETGERYWEAEYWQAYSITALAGEKVVVNSTTVNRYYPYLLEYHNRNRAENLIYKKGRAESAVMAILRALNADFREKEAGDYRLIYGLQGHVNPWTLPTSAVPDRLPQLDAPQISAAKGILRLVFKNPAPGGDLPFRMNVEIPGYSATRKRFSLGDPEILVSIPFPPDRPFSIHNDVDYQGIKIPSTRRETAYAPPPGAAVRTSRTPVFLSGIGPVVKVAGRKARLCEKEVRIQWNRRIGRKKKLRLVLYIPFDFDHQNWYGDYSQEVEVLVNGRRALTARLPDGENVIRISRDGVPWTDRQNVLELKFKYHLPFSFAPLWLTSALLEKMDIE